MRNAASVIWMAAGLAYLLMGLQLKQTDKMIFGVLAQILAVLFCIWKEISHE